MQRQKKECHERPGEEFARRVVARSRDGVRVQLQALFVVLDAPFAAEVEHVFHANVARSRPVELQQGLQRGGVDRLREWMARRFEFLL